MREELCLCRDFPSRAGRPFPWIVGCPLISLYLPEKGANVTAQTSSKVQPVVALWHSLECIHSKLKFCWFQSKAWDSYLMVTCMISTSYFVISHKLLSQPNHNLGFQLRNPASHTWIQHWNLENWFLNYFPSITVNHKKGLVPCACDSCRVPPRHPVQV